MILNLRPDNFHEVLSARSTLKELTNYFKFVYECNPSGTTFYKNHLNELNQNLQPRKISVKLPPCSRITQIRNSSEQSARKHRGYMTCCNYAMRELKLNELTWWTQGENCPWDRSLYSKFVNLQHSLLTDTRHTWETCYQRSLITTLDRFREFAPIVSSATWSTQSLQLYIVLTLFIADTPFS